MHFFHNPKVSITIPPSQKPQMGESFESAVKIKRYEKSNKKALKYLVPMACVTPITVFNHRMNKAKKVLVRKELCTNLDADVYTPYG